MSIAQQILNQDSFWIINKSIAKSVGVESALLLSELVGRDSYMENKVQIDDEWYFHATSDSLENSTTLSYKVQKRCFKSLKNEGFIKTTLRGVPAKLHFTICQNMIDQFVKTSIAQKSKLLYKNNNYKNNSISNTQKDLFGSVKPKGLHLFKNSPYYDMEVFRKKFSEAADVGVDVDAYWHALNDYSESKGKKYKDWAAAGRSFMRSDKDKGKLKMAGMNSANTIDLNFFNI